MSLNPALIAYLCSVASSASAAPHGGKEAVYAAACAHSGMSRATLLRKLKEVTVQPPRKQRSDAGTSQLALEQARRLSAELMQGFRANDKKIISVALALERLRTNLPGFACWTNPATGEIRELSADACTRALRGAGLHPEQLTRAAPAQPQRSEHPNDVWQIDASISTLFYVPDNAPLQDMSPGVFYKNKPGNFEKIKRQRLTRYVLTDHCSGAIFVHYVPGGESIANMAEAFLAAIAQRPGQQMYGVPFYLCMDPGSAGAAGAFKNLLRRLLVEPVVNKVGNARAKGQVENAHNLVECDFESGFKLTHVPSLAWINEQAQRWMRYYNSARVHSRHGKTRYAKWMEITQAQLRLAPAPELCRELLTHEPETRKVDQWLHVSFANRTWSVKTAPNVAVGEKLLVTHNPYSADAVFVLVKDADGHEQLLAMPEVTQDGNGFFDGAALVGREYKSPADTVLETNRKSIERLAMGADTDMQAAASRKAKALPFGGTHDPYKHHDNLPAVVTLPRRGTDLAPTTTTSSTALPARVLTQFEAAAELRRKGLEMTREMVASLRTWYPNGVPEAELDDLQARLTVRTGLRVVAGGAS